MRKLFSLFLALVATTSLLAQRFQVGDLYYEITSETTVKVTHDQFYSYDNYSSLTTAIIPETVTYNGTTYSVTSIGGRAFYYCSSLTSITIPNSVTSIGDEAFHRCTSLTSVTIGNSVTSIGEGAFFVCTSLTSITIPNRVTSIGDYAFHECSSLTSITIPNSVTSIGSYAFHECSSLTSITIPNSVTSIGNKAFDYCSSLTKTNYTGDIAGWCNIKFGDQYANPMCYSHNFYINDQEIKDLVIPNSITSIGKYTFYDCSSLTSVTIPNSVTSIGDGAFSWCSSLTSITIPNSVTSIGSSVFRNCSSLTSVTIPNSVTSIGSHAFYHCFSLTSPVYNAHCFAYLPTLFKGAYVIPEGIKQIAGGAFRDCRSLTSITIPNSVTSIGDDAFSGCSSLTTPVYNAHCFAYLPTSFKGAYVIPEGIKQIAEGAFCGCSSLTSVTIGNSVTSIGDAAFRYCSSLTSITIPNSVTSIGYGAFDNCSSLTSVTINSNAIVSNDYSDYSNISHIFGSQVTEYIIGDDVKGIGDAAFDGCHSLTSITIPNSVTSIGDAAFYKCSSLTSITCEAETPPTVGSSAFEGVSQSIPVYVPCGCVEAYKTANGWKNFTNIQEALAKYSIEVDVNDNIMGTATVDINSMCGAHISATANIGHHFVQWSDGNTDNPRTLTLTQDTVLTAKFALTIAGQCGDNLYWSYNESDQTISITGSGKMYDYTADTQPWFLFEEQIMEVVTSNTATSIGTSAFEGCLRLGKVSLGAAMENVAANAFAGCTRLYHIYCYPTYPPFADESSFANYNVNLYVPCNYLDNYKYDRVFGSFRYIQCIDSEDVTTDDVVVTPGTNDVTITWPTEGNADTYTIVIKKDGVVFCTLTFNADGQLLNIAFAPGRNGNHPAQYAEQAGNGYRFTVTGLEESTHYTYNIDVRDAADKTINSHAGEFTTQSITAVDNIQSPVTTCQKVMRNGQLIILRDGKTYTTMGAEIQ